MQQRRQPMRIKEAVCKQTYHVLADTDESYHLNRVYNYMPHACHCHDHKKRMEGEARSKRPRLPNFTEAELLAMPTSVAEKRNMILGKFTFDSASTAVRMKAAAWQDVTDAVSAVSRVQRDISDVKIKFKHFKSEVEKKRAKDLQYQKETGGGPAEKIEYTPAEEAILSLIPHDAMAGIPGIPHPDEVALAEEDNLDSPLPLEPSDVPGVSQSPSRDSTLFEEEWQQVHPRVMEVAQDLAVALGDHSYMSSHEHAPSTS